MKKKKKKLPIKNAWKTTKQQKGDDKIMTEKEKLRILREVDATMRMENMPLTTEDKRRLKSIADKKTTTKKEIEKILRNYKG